MAKTTFSGPVQSDNGFIGVVTGDVVATVVTCATLVIGTTTVAAGSATGTTGTQAGYIPVKIGSTVKYIPLYTSLTP